MKLKKAPFYRHVFVKRSEIPIAYIRMNYNQYDFVLISKKR